jgi:dUTP pyrophosphatase
MAKFEFVSKYADAGLPLPVRKTEYSAGYDMVAAEDTIIPPYENQVAIMALSNNVMDCDPKDLDWMGAFTKNLKTKPTLVPTGVKCKLEPGTYLELSVRSSSPLKYWLFLANGVGIIDADYYNNSDNEGHIYFQMINLSPFPIKIKKGEAIGQGIIHRFCITEDENATGLREGGFGSTTK